MEHLLAIGLCLVAGVALRQLAGRNKPGLGGAIDPDGLARALNAFAITVPLPALVLRQLVTLELHPTLLLPALVPWALLALSAGLVLLAARLRAWDRATTGALLLVVPLGNTSFLGLPLVEAWLGADALTPAILYDQAGSFVALALYGSLVVARYARTSAAAGPSPPSTPGSPSAHAPLAASPRAVAARLVRFPPFVAFVLALGLAPILPDGLPPALDAALALVAASLVPAVIVAVGLQWRLALPASRRGALIFALTVKLAVTPLAAWLLVVALGASGLAADATILEAAMGPMITAGALATAAGLAPDLVAAVIGYGTVASLGTSALVATTLLPV